MEVIGIDTRQISRVARILARNKPGLEKLDLFDPRFYPESNEPREDVLRFFIVMVALDHRLSRPGRPYEGFVDGEFYHGADLLYRLGKKKYDEDPGFYDPRHLEGIRVEEVREWLSIDGVSPPDVEVRTLLLRDLGFKLCRLYDCMVSRLIDESRNRLYGGLEDPGLIDRLKVFRAYEDPVEKKPLLLAKFLIVRGLFNPVDELDVAVDNHLSRIAYRLGIVMVSGELWEKIRNNIEVSREEDILLRMVIRRAYRLLAKESRVEPWILDDYFWIHGRRICLRDREPLCDKCIFQKVCLAHRNNGFMVSEHYYYNTWYY